MGTGDLTISLPSGLSVDDTKLLGQGNLWAVVGYAYINDVDTTNRYDFTVFREAGYDHLKIISQNGATVDSVDASVPMTWAAGDTFNLVVSGIPIVGWDSNSVMSEIDDGRSVCALTSKASPTLISGTIAAGSAVFAFDVIKDTHNSYDNTTGVYTCPVTGFYEVEYGARVTGSGTGGYITPKIIQAGGLANTYTKPTFFTGESQANGHGIVMKSHFYCEKGNTLSPRLESNFTSAALTSDVTANFFHVKKLNNSSLIANTELVACKYSTNAGQSISSGSYEIVDFEDKSYDTHNAVTVGASWKFTAPYSGKYHISAKTIFDTITLDSGEVVWSGIYKNGAANSYKVAHQAIGTGAVAVSADINIDIDLVEGDYVDYRAYQSSGGAVALYSANTYNQISIHRVS